MLTAFHWLCTCAQHNANEAESNVIKSNLILLKLIGCIIYHYIRIVYVALYQEFVHHCHFSVHFYYSFFSWFIYKLLSRISYAVYQCRFNAMLTIDIFSCAVFSVFCNPLLMDDSPNILWCHLMRKTAELKQEAWYWHQWKVRIMASFIFLQSIKECLVLGTKIQVSFNHRY